MSNFIPSPRHKVTFDLPKKRDPQARIRTMRHAAAEIIVESGASALTHRAVAQRAGVAVGTTTKYFATIEELRASALAFLSEQLAADMNYIESGIDGATDKVAYMAAEVHRFYADSRHALTDTALAYADVFTEDLNGLSMQWSERLIQVLTPHFGELRARTLSLFLDGYILDVALHGQTMDRATLEEIIRGITEMPVGRAGGVEHKGNGTHSTADASTNSNKVNEEEK
ncbi:TetR/AcrR family transcriptional regulator [Corynebacterium urogenitale]